MLLLAVAVPYAIQMSFEAADAESRDLSDLTEQQLKTLGEWEAKLDSKYPVVGTLPYQK